MAFTSGLHHVALTTTDLDRMVQIYRSAFAAEKAFEAPESPDGPRMAIVDVGGNGQYVKFLETGVIPDAARSAELFGLAVDTVEQLNTLRDHLRSAGYDVSDIERLPTQWILYLHDPEGGVVQVSAYA